MLLRDRGRFKLWGTLRILSREVERSTEEAC